MDKLITIQGVRAYIDQNGTAQLHQEDVARGLGFVERKGEAEYIRWGRLNGYMAEFGFATSGENEFIPEHIFYLLAMKANNETAISFQKKVACEILPSIRKHGMYAKDELLDNPDLLIEVITQLKKEREEKKLLQETINLKQKELEYKEDVIIGLVDEVELAEKRQILNRVVRHNNANFQERWKELYKQFDMKYHINVKQRMESYNKDHKPKMKSYLDYVDVVMGKVPELYEIAAKLYESDVKELAEQIYSLN